MVIKDGNKAVSDVAYYFSELAAIYPITPSSPMASNTDDLASSAQKNIFNDRVKVVEMQSEAGVAGALHGALISGSLASTFTSSQGLLLMIPNMYKIAGEMLPAVIHVASRSLATHALSIYGDHQDIYAVRQTGFCLLSSSSVEDSQYMAAIAHLAAVEGSLPFLHFFDGFRTSHEINSIKEIDLEAIGKLLNKNKVQEFRNRMLNVDNNIQKGMAEGEDIYFASTEARNKDYEQIVEIVNDYMVKINNIAATDYAPFNYYGAKNATNIIVAMGSVCDTIRLVVDKENKKGKKYGMIEVHLYRPFSAKYLKKVLPKTVLNIAVLDRTKEFGAPHEPLCLDVISALNDKAINIVGGRYGLASRDTTPAQIKSVFNMLESNLKDNFTIGINDDVTNLSLPEENYQINLKAQEIIIYGYGSDGMVSASKDILNIVANAKGKCVQGYFEYDSKKSGGVTQSNLRISSESVKAPFYIENPLCVVICKEEYLNAFATIDNIRENGLVILNTAHQDDLEKYLPDEFKKILKEKHAQLITVDADTLAHKYHLDGKISKIMELVILEVLGVPNAQDILEKGITKKFATKGSEIVERNINALKEVEQKVKIIKESFTYQETEKNEEQNIFDLINQRKGKMLKVSDLLKYKDGTFPCHANYNHLKISKKIPKWIPENCLECGLCSFVCPHGVIRSFILDDDNYVIAVNNEQCTGCGLCIEACPGKKGLKALEWQENDETKANEKLFTNYVNKEPANKYTIKNSQLLKPKFAYSGACAGCGQTAYIKLLTQLFQDDLIIANATGCSSIYGGSVPITPYNLPWANSLFEDNAEFGYGMYLSYQTLRHRLKNIMEKTFSEVSPDIQEYYTKWLDNPEDYKITREVKANLITKELPSELKELINYIPSRSIWCIGGDGWAYDIGFGGIDHVLSSNENINILVLDTEVYSNTGGQASKSSSLAQVAEFADMGKKTAKKDLFKMAMCYPNIYVASVCLGANGMQTIKAFKEAFEHQGPSLIIAYAPCVEQGIKNGMKCSLEEQKNLVKCGYEILMRYNNGKLTIDSDEPDFTNYEEALLNEVRFNALKIKNKKQAQDLLALNKEYAIKRYNYYKNLADK